MINRLTIIDGIKIVVSECQDGECPFHFTEGGYEGWPSNDETCSHPQGIGNISVSPKDKNGFPPSCPLQKTRRLSASQIYRNKERKKTEHK